MLDIAKRDIRFDNIGSFTYSLLEHSSGIFCQTEVMSDKFEQICVASIGRRSTSRLRLRLNARLTTLDGTCSVVLLNLSLSGAKILAETRLREGSEAILQWESLEAFGEIMWVDGSIVGLRFETEVDHDVLLAARTAPSWLSRDEEIARAALAWVSGRGRVGLGT